MGLGPYQRSLIGVREALPVGHWADVMQKAIRDLVISDCNVNVSSMDKAIATQPIPLSMVWSKAQDCHADVRVTV